MALSDRSHKSLLPSFLYSPAAARSFAGASRFPASPATAVASAPSVAGGDTLSFTIQAPNEKITCELPTTPVLRAWWSRKRSRGATRPSGSCVWNHSTSCKTTTSSRGRAAREMRNFPRPRGNGNQRHKGWDAQPIRTRINARALLSDGKLSNLSTSFAKPLKTIISCFIKLLRITISFGKFLQIF